MRKMAVLWLLAAAWLRCAGGADTIYLGLLMDTDNFVFVETLALFKLVGCALYVVTTAAGAQARE